MASLDLILAPDPIFKKTATAVTSVDDTVRAVIDQMFEVLYREKGLGIGANMVGILDRIVVVDMQEDGKSTPLALVNPEITEVSEETQTFPEASLSYPGIRAEITRPKQITVTYLDRDGISQTLKADGWFAQVLQHEIDYLDGKVFLDYLKPVKRQMLIKKMQKYKKHSHGEGCPCC
ncbi:peptide deformylase [Kordiimonas sediminis]|uniref:Peptide deformylase-like n=1 Tax=Kordiimonas sediminis TaxID=1735581 RepID=A0A919E483_9PROT|nr:peptide deformylase [Kordiimonas sediminis]GHF12060.1 peptide deformylase [Kordiimonas sediminis]